MKLDLDYIKTLLNAINDCNDDRVSMQYLIKALKINMNEEQNLGMKKLRHHLFLLYQSGFLETSTSDLVFLEGSNGMISCMANAKYWLTMSGYKLQESINNDSLFNNIKKGLKDIEIDTLKKIPSLAIEFLIKASIGS